MSSVTPPPAPLPSSKGKEKDTTCVSLPDYLRDVLLPLLTLQSVPEDIRAELGEYVKPAEQATPSTTQEIPYSLLQHVSRWSQTAEGKVSLKDASLDPSDYLPISLLAGLVTSPSAILAPYVPPLTPAQVRREATKSRRSIIAIINAVFSIVGVGVAVWKASETTRWTDGIRILCALFGALVVAIAEGGLYLIYTSRSKSPVGITSSPAQKAKRKVKGPIVSLEIPQQDPLQDAEKDSPSVDATIIPDTVQDSADSGVRRRVPGRPEVTKPSVPS